MSSRDLDRGRFFRRRRGAPEPAAARSGPPADRARAREVPERRARTPALPAAWRLALTWGAAAALVALMTVSGTSLRLPWGTAADLAVGVVLGLALLGLGSLMVATLHGLVSWLPSVLGAGVVVASLGALAMLVGFASTPPLLALSAWGIWLAAFVALSFGVAVGLAPPAIAPAARRWLRYLAPAAGLATFMLVIGWWFDSGAAVAATTSPDRPPPLDAADPGRPGPYQVGTFRYGGALPRWRDDYADRDALRTSPVDLADLVGLSGIHARLRPLALGHDLATVPRNAVVWHPAGGDGPFPLVLVAHGNANLFTPSELGYAWLGEHLASHGFVVASIDASAFNALPVVGGLRNENDARALLMLSHLQLWGDLRAQGHAVAARVDPSRIALIGHSRGGEAAALAAALDRLGRLPEDAGTPLAERVGGPYGIRAVVAIAPSDMQFRPGDRGAVLQDVDYLVIQGGHDGDVSTFMGERQFERTAVPDGGIKAAVYLHRANHGQFNTEWGSHDLPGPLGTLLDTGALMEAEEQRRAGAVLITAFLRATLAGDAAYRRVLREPAAAPSWPEEPGVVVRVDEGGAVVLAGFAEDVDPATGTYPGSRIAAHGLALWREGDPGYRSGVTRDANAATLAWRREAGERVPSYDIVLPDDLLALAPGGGTAMLRLEVARGTAEAGGVPAPHGPLDASLTLVDGTGARASVPLSAAGGVPPDLPARITRFGPAEAARYQPDRYPLYATLELPLSWFEIDLASVRQVSLEFDRTSEGIVVIRSVALVPGRD